MSYDFQGGCVYLCRVLSELDCEFPRAPCKDVRRADLRRGEEI